MEQISFWHLNPTKKILTKGIDRLYQKESDSGLSEEELLLQIKIKEELQDIIYKEEISGNKNLEFNGSDMGTTISTFFRMCPTEERQELSSPCYKLTI